MSSEINNQFVNIQQLVTPQCVNTITSPSLPLTAGALVYDKSTPNSLYFSNGTQFLQVVGGSGGTGGSDSVLGTGINVGPITFTGSGVSGMTGSMTIQSIEIGSTYQNILTVKLYQSPNVGAATTWTSPAGTIPPEFIPSGPYRYAPYELYSSAASGYTTTWFYIDSSGVIHINNTATSGSVTIDQLSMTYL
jgi:hypothetical protein